MDSKTKQNNRHPFHPFPETEKQFLRIGKKTVKSTKELETKFTHAGEAQIKLAHDIGRQFKPETKQSLREAKKIGKDIIDTQKKNLEIAGKIGTKTLHTGREGIKTGVAITKDLVKISSLPYKKRRSISDFFWHSKKGIITGAADNDPSGIVTYTQTGALTGYNLLWLAPLAWPLLVAIERMSAKIGIVKQKGINQVIIENYGKGWAWFATLIVVVCNILTIGADIAAMSDICSIIFGFPQLYFTLLFGLLFIYLLVSKGYRTVSRYLFLLTPIFILYIISAFLFDVPWMEALKNTFIPALSAFQANYALVAVAFLGTTITPFLVYWETTQEIEERTTIKQMAQENTSVNFGMFFTQFITFFIMIAAAAAFAGNNQLIQTAKDAALALEPLGKSSFLLFSLGIIGSGLIAVPILAATTGYIVSENVGWTKGLSHKVPRAKGFYSVIFIAIIIGALISASGFNPILMLLYSQVFNGILMPILIILLLVINNNKKIMGKYTNTFWINFFGIIALMLNVAFVILMFANWGK